MINILLIVIIFLIAGFLIMRRLKKTQDENVEEKVQVDDKNDCFCKKETR